MNWYGRPLSSTSFSVKLLQYAGAPQIVAHKQELEGLVGHRDATSFLRLSIASPMPELSELLLRAPRFQSDSPPMGKGTYGWLKAHWGALGGRLEL